jgi:hypothetical protein
MTSFRDEVLNYPRAGLSLAEVKTRRDHLANLPPELFEMAEQAAGPGASFTDRLRALVVAMRQLLIDAQAAEAAPTTKPAAKPAAGTPATPKGVDRNAGAQASEGVSPDVELANAADAIALSEGVAYGEAMLLAAERDPELARRYHEDSFGAERSDLPVIPVPFGHRLIDRRADEELAEKAEARRLADDIELGEAMLLVLAEDEALATRYMDYTSGNSALDELAYRVSTIQAAATPREHMTPAKAVGMALSEDPALKVAVACYYERG